MPLSYEENVRRIQEAKGTADAALRPLERLPQRT
jgi:hypothetical protein